MKAVMLVNLNEPLEIWNLEPSSLKAGQVLVRVLVSGICGAQLQEIKGYKGNERFLPHLMGHEGYGVVESIGPGVTRVKVGNSVVMHWRPGAGIESEFPKYLSSGKSYSGGKVTTLSEMSVVSENRLTVVPSDTNPEIAALLGCSVSTALAFIEKESELMFGEAVLVIGCGGLGLNLIAAARLRGAGVIVGLDLKESKRELVLNQGASDFFTEREKIYDKFDLIIDTTGNVEILDWAFERMSGQGRMSLIGQPNPSSKLQLTKPGHFFNGNGLKLFASQGGSFLPQFDIPRYLKLFELGILDISNLVTHRFELERVNDAFEILKSGDAGRILLQTSH